MEINRKFRAPRIWSNDELRKFAHLFEGDVINVSGWKDEDKQGSSYKNYFVKSKSYTISNYKSEARGFQGNDGEIYLDLEKELPIELHNKFDVVFNHTTLEHIYHVNTAIKNLCQLSKDAIVLVVPFLQEMHGEYGDYWRFTPSAIIRMLSDNGFSAHYLSFNKEPLTSVYVFCIAFRDSDKWNDRIEKNIQSGLDLSNRKEGIIGFNAHGELSQSKKKRKFGLF
ncbi:MAG: hypothetical protein RH860_12595 [Cytophagales bacterium]